MFKDRQGRRGLQAECQGNQASGVIEARETTHYFTYKLHLLQRAASTVFIHVRVLCGPRRLHAAFGVTKQNQKLMSNVGTHLCGPSASHFARRCQYRSSVLHYSSVLLHGRFPSTSWTLLIQNHDRLIATIHI